ncbi:MULTISPECIES: polyamine ABC transporter substrate-binding protein [unclassified Acidisoma]|jgi:putrescine transport system substrate-binding protein|uniref:polyamine ABC transporter substrate-binding protein n=1 Tax=unclassified Acidisoma TaxID=2634065 RepID=UPI001C20A4EC|nr:MULTISPECIES: polyamine ABC transporter substrate-binding protein [unclassified Acidisoma]
MMRSKTLIWVGALAAATLLSGHRPAAADQPTIYVYNWAEYIGTDTLKNFTKETGIKVVYDTYDSSETVQAKLMAGHTGYDVVVHSASNYGPQDIKAGIYMKLDKSKLPNLANLDPSLVKRYDSYDPDMQYGVPYMWGTTGFTYNVDMIKQRMPDAPVGSLAMLFDPAVVSKFKDCGVSFFDGPTDVMPMALSYLHINPNTQNPADYRKAKEMLAKIRSNVRVFDNSNYLTALPQKSICIAMTWSGDYATAVANAQSAKANVNLAYTIPKEGSGLWFDAVFIPSDAKNVDGALKFINYLQRPDVMAGITEVTNYANANYKSTPLIPKSITGDPANYPDAETMKRTFGEEPLPPKATKAETRAFSDFKTGS